MIKRFPSGELKYLVHKTLTLDPSFRYQVKQGCVALTFISFLNFVRT